MYMAVAQKRCIVSATITIILGLTFQVFTIDLFSVAPTTFHSDGENIILIPQNNSIHSNKIQLLSDTDDEKQNRNIADETERCKRYGFSYYDSRRRGTLSHRRRVFVGSLIADDSWAAIEAVAAEGYGLYHTVSFVESNSSLDGSPRKPRFLTGSENWKRLTNGTLYGPTTHVHVDYWSRPDKIIHEPWGDIHGLLDENIQRDMIVKRWKMNGMKPDDIGIVQDTDETFTRDFLIALQTCDIKLFRSGQDCKYPKINGYTLIFESSPSCIWSRRKWFHPDVIIGECIETIGSSLEHPKIHRGGMNGTTGGRPDGHNGNDDEYDKKIYLKNNPNTTYPLWNAYDFRMTSGGNEIKEKHKIVQRKEKSRHVKYRKSHTGFHFHNFFDDIKTLRNKYLTYGHANDQALELPLEDLSDDMRLSIECALEIEGDDDRKYIPGGLSNIKYHKPLYFTEHFVRQRHELFRQMIKNETNLVKDN